MVNPDFVASLEWYQEKSKSIESVPRCPFAALRRCPKYYSSIWLMGEIDETEDKKLRKYWEQTDLWPISQELEPAGTGTPKALSNFSNICPEVAYERFGYFASGIYAYADEIDRDCAHKKLSERNANGNDWRWRWSGIVAQHYSECPMYSQLLPGVKEVPSSETKRRIGF